MRAEAIPFPAFPPRRDLLLRERRHQRALIARRRAAATVDATLTHATGTAEREATLVMLDRR